VLIPVVQGLSQKQRQLDRQCGKTDASKDGAALLGQHSQATGHKGGGSHTQRHVNSANGGGFESNQREIMLFIGKPKGRSMMISNNQTMFLTQAQALLGKAISEHTTQQHRG